MEADDDTPVAGAAVYLWHCNRDGEYLMYSDDIADENYLRGVQASDAAGRVSFTSIYPAPYAGRRPHVRFEVYRSLDEATAAGRVLATSQIALPEDTCATVYATSGYEQSVRKPGAVLAHPEQRVRRRRRRLPAGHQDRRRRRRLHRRAHRRSLTCGAAHPNGGAAPGVGWRSPSPMTITSTGRRRASQCSRRGGGTVSGQSVLVVEDTDEIRELVAMVLRRAGMDVREVASGAACLEEVRRDAPDVVVLDLGLPDADGTEVCRQLRAETDCYVLMLTARAEEVDLLIGLAVGADGYMAKPFSPRELVARVQTMLRRPRTPAAPGASALAEDSVRRLAELEVDPDSREVRVGGAAVDLTRTEFDLLSALVSRPGRVLQRETLLREVWQTDWEGNLRLVEAHMSNLRRKLTAAGLNSPEIRTVRGVGYRLVA